MLTKPEVIVSAILGVLILFTSIFIIHPFTQSGVLSMAHTVVLAALGWNLTNIAKAIIRWIVK